MPENSEPGEGAPEPFVIPGNPEEVADEIGSVSIEGRPGDPKSAPRLLRTELLIAAGAILFTAVVVGIWISPVVALVMLAIGAIGMFVNPVVAATVARANEREEVVRHKTLEQQHQRGR